MSTKNTILCFSDLHNKLPIIPSHLRNRDTTIVFCGDTFNNDINNITPGIIKNGSFRKTNWKIWNYRTVDEEAERLTQNNYINKVFIPHLKSNNINLDNVLILNGNHCYADVDMFFRYGLKKGARNIIYKGTKIGLVTGVIQSIDEWNDEITEEEFKKRLDLIDPETQILITHVPPYNVLDSEDEGHLGSQAISRYIFGKPYIDLIPRFNNLRLHMFGHAHGARGTYEYRIDNSKNIQFYNAAKSRYEINFKFGQKLITNFS